jgi:hypothetical protein
LEIRTRHLAAALIRPNILIIRVLRQELEPKNGGLLNLDETGATAQISIRQNLPFLPELRTRPAHPLNAFNMHFDEERGWHYHVTPGKFPYIIGGYYGEAERRGGRRGPPRQGRGEE